MEFRPSGFQLPLILRKKLELQKKERLEQQQRQQAQKQNEENAMDTSGGTNNGTSPDKSTTKTTATVKTPDDIHNDDTDSSINDTVDPQHKSITNYTSETYDESLEHMHYLTGEIQRHLYRGEEAYFLDTLDKGNVFRGWDSIVDSKLSVETIPSRNGTPGKGELRVSVLSTGSTGKKRISSDDRWFSSSCSYPRNKHRNQYG